MAPAAPVPVFIPVSSKENKGMAGNVYENFRSLGVHCDLITNSSEIIKTRYIDQNTNHMIVRIDSGEEKIERIEDPENIDFSPYDAVVISDYDKGFLAVEDIEIIAECHELVFMDTKKPLGEWNKNCNFIKINEIEYNTSKYFYPAIDDVLYENLIVTLGNKGCRYKDKRSPVKKVDVKDMTGAGDSFLAGLVVKYLTTKNIEKSIKFANECATQVVQRKGVVTINEN